MLADLQLLATKFSEVTTPKGKEQLANAIDEVTGMAPSLSEDDFEQMPAYKHSSSGPQNNNSTSNQNIGTGQQYIGINHIGTQNL